MACSADSGSESDSSGYQSDGEHDGLHCIAPTCIAAIDCTPADQREEVANTLERALTAEFAGRTDHAIHKYFHKYAHSRKSDGSMGVNKQQATQMGPEVAAYLEVPAAIFGKVPKVFQRFNFDGSGILNKLQCTTLYRSIIRQRRKEWGGPPEEEVPKATIKQKGYEVGKELGRGGQGVMYLASKPGEQHEYCIKFYSKSEGQDDDEIMDLINEHALMKKLSNPHIAQTFEVFQDDQFFYLVNEPYFGGDLTKVGKKAHSAGVKMTERWWRDLFSQCLEGLAYLHSNAVMHCDIKEDNIMIGKASYQKPHIVLIDFGLAEAFACATAGGQSGTPGYIPPETWEQGMWYPRGDLFSMGIVFFQLLIGRTPRDDVMGILQTDGDDAQDMAAARALQLPWDHFPIEMPLLRDLVAQMTQRDLYKRPSAAAALEHAWFSADGNAELPPANLAALVGASAAQCTRAEVIEDLAKNNDLQSLRELQGKFQDLDAARAGRVAAAQAAKLLEAQAVPQEVAARCAQDCADAKGNIQYQSLMEESIHLKERYAQQLIKDLFAELDLDKDGSLSKEELTALLNGELFTGPYEDLDELMEDMDADSDGVVSFKEFQRVMLNDGRIARRSDLQSSASKRSTCTCQ